MLNLLKLFTDIPQQGSLGSETKPISSEPRTELCPNYWNTLPHIKLWISTEHSHCYCCFACLFQHRKLILQILQLSKLQIFEHTGKLASLFMAILVELTSPGYQTCAGYGVIVVWQSLYLYLKVKISTDIPH